MEGRRQITTWLLLALCVGFLFFVNAQESDGTVPSEGSSADIDTMIHHCSFRGTFLNHKNSIRLDPCTECTCDNGTATCHIESCTSDAGCDQMQIVVISEECCPQCPYDMFVKGTQNLYEGSFDFSEGETKNVKFGLDVEVDRRLSSRIVQGENLWKLSAWISPNEDGSGKKFSLKDNVFNENDAANEYNKRSYPPWDWLKLKYTMAFTGGTCDDYRYFCIEFGVTNDTRPAYNLLFTFQAIDNDQHKLIDCVPLGECKGGDSNGFTHQGESSPYTSPSFGSTSGEDINGFKHQGESSPYTSPSLGPTSKIPYIVIVPAGLAVIVISVLGLIVFGLVMRGRRIRKLGGSPDKFQHMQLS